MPGRARFLRALSITVWQGQGMLRGQHARRRTGAPLFGRHPRSDVGCYVRLAAVSRSYTHSAQITNTFNAIISSDHTG